MSSICFTTKLAGAQQRKTVMIQRAASMHITHVTLEDRPICSSMHPRTVRLYKTAWGGIIASEVLSVGNVTPQQNDCTILTSTSGQSATALVVIRWTFVRFFIILARRVSPTSCANSISSHARVKSSPTSTSCMMSCSRFMLKNRRSSCKPMLRQNLSSTVKVAKFTRIIITWTHLAKIVVPYKKSHHQATTHISIHLCGRLSSSLIKAKDSSMAHLTRHCLMPSLLNQQSRANLKQTHKTRCRSRPSTLARFLKKSYLKAVGSKVRV